MTGFNFENLCRESKLYTPIILFLLGGGGGGTGSLEGGGIREGGGILHPHRYFGLLVLVHNS